MGNIIPYDSYGLFWVAYVWGSFPSWQWRHGSHPCPSPALYSVMHSFVSFLNSLKSFFADSLFNESRFDIQAGSVIAGSESLASGKSRKTTLYMRYSLPNFGLRIVKLFDANKDRRAILSDWNQLLTINVSLVHCLYFFKLDGSLFVNSVSSLVISLCWWL